MKKLIIILTLINLTSFCFAQDVVVKLQAINNNTANKILSSHCPKTTFKFPTNTILFDLCSVKDASEEINLAIDCGNEISNTLESLVDESGYEANGFSTEAAEKRIIVSATKGESYFLWSIKYDYFIENYRDKNNRLQKVFVCYGYDLNKNDHIKFYDKTKRFDENGKVIVPDTTIFPPVKK